MKKISGLFLSILAAITIATSINVNASAKTVTVIKRVTAKKVKVARVAVNDTFIGKKVLKPGRKIAVHETASWGWAISGKGIHNNQKHFWVVIKPDDTSWFK